MDSINSAMHTIMNFNWFALMPFILGFVGIYIVIKLCSSVWHFVISALILLLLFGGGWSAFKNHLDNPQQFISYMTKDMPNQILSGFNQFKASIDGQVKSNAISPSVDSSIVNRLKSYTDNAEAGPTGNYYWDAGAAHIGDFSGIDSGNLQFSTDTKGRAGVAKGILTYQMYKDSKGSRQGTPLDPPDNSWPQRNPKVQIKTKISPFHYRGFFWNRSHSIADSLGGTQSYASSANFTSGTRMQNVGANQNGGMRAAEEIAENYWKSHPGSTNVIYYQTNPVYIGDEIIPRGSVVDIKVSDNSISRRIVVINDAEGWNINYNTGQISKR